MTEAPRVAIVGTGRMARIHADAVSRVGGSVGWVVGSSEGSAAELAGLLGACGSGNLSLVLAERPDAVVVASPTPTHAAIVDEILDTDISVLCEKPLDLDSSRARALAQRARDSEARLAVGFNRRFDPGFARAWQEVDSGRIGAAETVVCTSRDPEPPPRGYLPGSGGIFRDMTIHDFDLARQFLPDVISVTATGSAQFDEDARTLGDFDTATVVLRSSSGVLATIVNSRRSSRGYDQRLEVIGASGAVTVDNRPTDRVRISGSDDRISSSSWETDFAVLYRDSYVAQMREFLTPEDEPAARLATFEDGWAALALADAALISAREGRRVTTELDLGAPVML